LDQSHALEKSLAISLRDTYFAFSLKAGVRIEMSNAQRNLHPIGNKLRPISPDSLMWKDFGSYHYQLMLPQAFVLQTAHPVINAAVWAGQKYKLDPWGRAKDSVELLWPVIYSRPEEAIKMGHALRERHREIKGVDAQGKKYHALDPEAFSWVHITGFDVMLRLHEFFDMPLDEKQRATLFDEWKRVGALLGIHDRYIPETEAEYWRIFNDMIDTRLEWTDVVNDLMDPDFYRRYPKPPKSRHSDFTWRLFCIPFSWFQRLLIMETLPQRARDKWQLRSSLPNRLAFRAFCFLFKRLYPKLPESRRYIYLAFKAIEDARRNPEAYRTDELLAEQS
jgi:uncharacterized protein (DUF2236 family)